MSELIKCKNRTDWILSHQSLDEKMVVYCVCASVCVRFQTRHCIKNASFRTYFNVGSLIKASTVAWLPHSKKVQNSNRGPFVHQQEGLGFSDRLE